MVDYLSLLNELALIKLNFSVTNHNSDKSLKKKFKFLSMKTAKGMPFHFIW